MKAIVIGATGATGKSLTEQLLSTDWITEVVVLVRRKSFENHQKLYQMVVDFDNLEKYAPFITGDVAFSCLGTTLKSAGSKDAQWKVDYDYQFRFAEIARKNDVKTFVLCSAANANPDSVFFYSKMKGKLEKSITELNFERLILFRPGILDRPNSDRPMERMSVISVKALNSIGLARSQTPTCVSDLAKAMIQSVRVIHNKLSKVDNRQIRSLIKDIA